MTDAQAGELFLIDQKVLDDQLPSMLDKGMERPAIAAQWVIVLPFVLEVPDGIAISVVSSTSASMFVFGETVVEHTFRIGDLGSSQVDMPMPRTRVEMCYLGPNDLDMDLTDWPPEEVTSGVVAFIDEIAEMLVGELNQLILSYSLATGDDVPSPVTMATLPHTVSSVRLAPLAQFSDGVTAGLIHPTPEIRRELMPSALAEADLDVWENLLMLGSASDDPFLLAEEFLLNSQRFVRSGGYRETLLNLHIGTEVFLRAVHRGLEAQVKASSAVPFATLVKSELHSILGGNWNVKQKGSTPVSDWWQKVYEVRNRVAHAGYVPSDEEANKAIVVTRVFWQWIGRLIEQKRNDYPDFWSQLQSRIPLYWWLDEGE